MSNVNILPKAQILQYTSEMHLEQYYALNFTPENKKESIGSLMLYAIRNGKVAFLKYLINEGGKPAHLFKHSESNALNEAICSCDNAMTRYIVENKFYGKKDIINAIYLTFSLNQTKTFRFLISHLKESDASRSLYYCALKALGDMIDSKDSLFKLNQLKKAQFDFKKHEEYFMTLSISNKHISSTLFLIEQGLEININNEDKAYLHPLLNDALNEYKQSEQLLKAITPASSSLLPFVFSYHFTRPTSPDPVTYLKKCPQWHKVAVVEYMASA